MRNYHYTQAFDGKLLNKPTEGYIEVVSSVRADSLNIRFGPCQLQVRGFAKNPKVIISALRHTHCYNDFSGKYAINGDNTLAIPVDTNEHAELVCALLRSEYWQSFHMAMNYTTFTTDRHLFGLIDWSEENMQRIIQHDG